MLSLSNQSRIQVAPYIFFLQCMYLENVSNDLCGYMGFYFFCAIFLFFYKQHFITSFIIFGLMQNWHSWRELQLYCASPCQTWRTSRCERGAPREHFVPRPLMYQGCFNFHQLSAIDLLLNTVESKVYYLFTWCIGMLYCQWLAI